jgi:hypothetical protein
MKDFGNRFAKVIFIYFNLFSLSSMATTDYRALSDKCYEDPKHGCRPLEKACRKKDGNACLYLALAQFKLNNQDEAASLVKLACSYGQHNACNLMKPKSAEEQIDDDLARVRGEKTEDFHELQNASEDPGDAQAREEKTRRLQIENLEVQKVQVVEENRRRNTQQMSNSLIQWGNSMNPPAPTSKQIKCTSTQRPTANGQIIVDSDCK